MGGSSTLTRREKINKANLEIPRKFKEINEKSKQKKLAVKSKPSPFFISQTREAWQQSSSTKDRVPDCCHYKPLLDVIKPRTPSFTIALRNKTSQNKDTKNEENI